MLRLLISIATAVVLPAAVVLLDPRAFNSAALALGLAPVVGALANFFAVAVVEEASKAIAICIADLRRSAFSWFWIAGAAAGSMALAEAALRFMYIQGDVAFANARAIPAHIALSLVCVALARLMKGGVTAWSAAILATGVLHNLTNYGRVLGAWFLIVSFVLFVAVIVLAFVWRQKFDWRVPQQERSAHPDVDAPQSTSLVN